MHASEIHQIVLVVGPATLIMAKITRSLIFMLFAKLYANLRRRRHYTNSIFRLHCWMDFESTPDRLSEPQELRLRNFPRNYVQISANDGSVHPVHERKLVRPPGFEPGSSAWQADVLTKLDYGRVSAKLQV